MWYRLSGTSIDQATRKAMESLATNIIRGKLLTAHMVKPSDTDVALGVKRVMREIEREHGSITKAALSSPIVELKPVVEAAIHNLKW